MTPHGPLRPRARGVFGNLLVAVSLLFWLTPAFCESPPENTKADLGHTAVPNRYPEVWFRQYSHELGSAFILSDQKTGKPISTKTGGPEIFFDYVAGQAWIGNHQQLVYTSFFGGQKWTGYSADYDPKIGPSVVLLPKKKYRVTYLKKWDFESEKQSWITLLDRGRLVKSYEPVFDWPLFSYKKCEPLSSFLAKYDSKEKVEWKKSYVARQKMHDRCLANRLEETLQGFDDEIYTVSNLGDGTALVVKRKAAFRIDLATGEAVKVPKSKLLTISAVEINNFKAQLVKNTNSTTISKSIDDFDLLDLIRKEFSTKYLNRRK